MRRKQFTHAITFPTTPEVYEALKKDSDAYNISLSDLMRRLSEDYLNGTRTYSRHSVEEKEIEETSIKEADPNEQS
jgi:hypothetical protein